MDTVVPEELRAVPTLSKFAYAIPRSRARSISPPLRLENLRNAEPWEGYGTRVNGSIMFSDRNNAPRVIGNIHEPLSLSALPFP